MIEKYPLVLTLNTLIPSDLFESNNLTRQSNLSEPYLKGLVTTGVRQEICHAVHADFNANFNANFVWHPDVAEQSRQIESQNRSSVFLKFQTLKSEFGLKGRK